MQHRSRCRSLIHAAAVVAFTFSSPLTVLAQTQQAPAPGAQISEARAKIGMANGLVAYGQQTKDGQVLLVAVKLLSSVGGAVQDPHAKMSDGKPANFDLKALLNEAKTYAAGNDGLLKDIAAQEQAIKLGYCYWQWTCNPFNCDWVYVC